MEKTVLFNFKMWAVKILENIKLQNTLSEQL